MEQITLAQPQSISKPATASKVHISIRDLEMSYGDLIIQQNLTFDINRGEVFIVMGASGCGKSTLLRHLIGLMPPAKGSILYDGKDFWESDDSRRVAMMQRFGILYQSGALWSSMTLAENIA